MKIFIVIVFGGIIGGVIGYLFGIKGDLIFVTGMLWAFIISLLA